MLTSAIAALALLGAAGNVSSTPFVPTGWTKSPAIAKRQSAVLRSDLKVRFEKVTTPRILVSMIETPTIPYVQSVDVASFKRRITVSDPRVTVSDLKATKVGNGSAVVYTAIVKPNGVQEFSLTAYQTVNAVLYTAEVRKIQPDPEVDAYIDGLLASYDTREAGWSHRPEYPEFLQANGLQYTGQQPWEYLRLGYSWFGKNIQAIRHSTGTIRDITEIKKSDCLSAARYTGSMWSSVGSAAELTGQYYRGNGHIMMLLKPVGGSWYPIDPVLEIKGLASRGRLFSELPVLMAIKSVHGPCMADINERKIDLLCSYHQGGAITVSPLDLGSMNSHYEIDQFSSQ